MKNFLPVKKRTMSFYDNFVDPLTLHRTNFQPAAITHGGTGYSPSNFTRTLEFERMEWGPTTGAGAAFVNNYPQYTLIDFSIAGDKPLDITNRAYATIQSGYPHLDNCFYKLFYNLSYTRVGSDVFNITGKTGLKMEGLGRVDFDNNVYSLSLSVKLIIKSKVGLLLGRLEGDYFYINSIESTQTIPFSGLTSYGYFNPAYVTAIELHFYVARTVVRDTMFDAVGSFWLNKISMV